MTTLSNQDKLTIVNQHLKSIDYSIYNIDLDLLEAGADSQTSAETVTLLNARKTALNAKRAVLETEAASLTE